MPAPTSTLSRRRLALGVAVLVSVVGLGACSTPNPSQDQFTESLVISGVDPEVAECTSKAVMDNLSDEQVRRINERGGGAAPVDDAAKPDEAADKVREALAACRDLLPTTTLPVAPSTTAPAAATSAPTTSGAALEPATSEG